MFKHFYVIMIMRIVFFVYWIYLSILLLSQHPERWIGTSGNIPEFLQILMPYAHILSFTVLSLLVFTACFPLPRWGILLTLAIYGGATEIIQGFNPPRTPKWADWFRDLGGIAIGFTCFWLVIFLLRMMRKNETLELPSSS
ncbi:MAG: VanZ family protein [Thermoguttaceae bacterium]